MADDRALLASRRNIPVDLDKIFNDLLDLADGSVSSPVSEDMPDKDVRAQRAIQMSGELIGALITWAINHEAGKILDGVDSYVSHAPHRLKTRKAAAYTLKQNLALNSQDNERRGVAYKGDDPVINRKLVAKVLYLLSSKMKFVPGQKVGIALGQLDFGKVAAVLKPVKANRKHLSVDLDAARLTAVLHVEFRRGAGKTKEEALGLVATEYSVTVHALQKWQTKSRTSLPSIDQGYFIDICERARELGHKHAGLTGTQPNPKSDETVQTARAATLRDKHEIARYSDAALIVDGTNYKALARKAKLPRRFRQGTNKV